jgi:hypothetical protein
MSNLHRNGNCPVRGDGGMQPHERYRQKKWKKTKT